MSWEQAVIGTVLFNPTSMEEAQDLLPSDFSGIHQVIWAEMLALHQRGELDARAAIESVANSGDWQRFSSSDIGNDLGAYFKELLDQRGATLKIYVDKVLEASIKRALQRSMALIAAQAEAENTSADEILDYAEKQILKLRRNRMDTALSLADLMAVWIPRLEGMRDGSIKPAWTPKVLAVKEVVRFLEGADFMTVAARPGDGKSSYMRFEAFRHAQDGGRVLIFNLENDPLEYARYFMALYTGIDSWRLKEPQYLTVDELECIKEIGAHIGRLGISVQSLSAPSVSQIVTMARRMIAEQRFNLVMVDYLQLVQNGVENKVQDVAATTAALRGLALETGVPVLAASQLSRDIEKRGEAADPQLSDLRDSGSIEQDSTIVTFLRSPWLRQPNPAEMRMFPENIDPATGQVFPRPKAIPVKFHVLKNRNGETGTSEVVKWNKGTGNFQTLTQESRRLL